METPHFKPEITTETQEREPQIFRGIVFTAHDKRDGTKLKKEYRSSAKDRKIAQLIKESPKPEPGKPYKVRVVEDTMPEDPMQGKFYVEIIPDPEEAKRYNVALARGAEEALAKNDLNGVLEKLRELQRVIGVSEGGIENPGQRERLEQLEKEFEYQTQTLLNKELPRLANISSMAFVEMLEPLKEKLKELATREFPPGHIPFVIVPGDKLLSFKNKVSFMEVDGKKAVDTTGLLIFKTAEGIETPASLAYLVVDVDNGTATLGKNPSQAMKQLKKEERSPLTADEGVAMIVQRQEILKRMRLDFTGSRNWGDVVRVPALWLDPRGVPNLNYNSMDHNPDPDVPWGTPSCGSRVGLRGAL